jgi:hypothetical protein
MGRTWIASPDGKTGDGLLSEILLAYAAGDSIRCLPGEHLWDQGGVPLIRNATIYGDAKESVILSGEWFSFINCDSLVVRDLSLRGFGIKGGGISRVRFVNFSDVEISESQSFTVTIGERAEFARCEPPRFLRRHPGLSHDELSNFSGHCLLTARPVDSVSRRCDDTLNPSWTPRSL